MVICLYIKGTLEIEINKGTFIMDICLHIRGHWKRKPIKGTFKCRFV